MIDKSAASKRTLDGSTILMACNHYQPLISGLGGDQVCYNCFMPKDKHTRHDFPLDVGCNNDNPPEVVAALISIALLAIGGLVAALARRVSRR